MVKLSKYFFVFFITLFSIWAQSIEEKNKELAKLKDEVSVLERRLNSIKDNESKSLELLHDLNRQSLLMNRIINNLSQQEKIKENSILKLNDTLLFTEKKMDELEKSYAKYARWLFTYGNDSKYKLLFTSNSLNQALIRYKYFNMISGKSENLFNSLKEKKEMTELIKSQLEAEKKDQRQIRQKKEEEQKVLSAQKDARKKLIAELKSDQNNIEREIEEKRRAEIIIKNLIAKLIEEEREREKKAREQRLKNDTAAETKHVIFNYDSFQNFIELKGRLAWPVDKGNVLRAFGENRNEKLKTVTLNYGIDIQTSSNTNVYAVAQGVVSAIDWIPGYGSVVILTHKNNFRTVYGHITDIIINEGEIVNAGDLIGKVNESLEGSIIHFEVWSERNYQDPEIWLAKQ